MHAAVVANCQARPVADLLGRMSGEIDQASTIIVHLAKADGKDADYAILDKADVIYAQFVTDSYFAAHLATSRLIETFGNRVITWPNIYFRGQCPDLGYAVSERRRIVGPLREYHHRSVYDCWKLGISEEECLAMLQAEDPGYQGEMDVIANTSLKDLKSRESSLHVGIAEVIEAEWRRRRLFFTFNHPTSFLLDAMARRLVAASGLSAGERPIDNREPLGLVIPPVLRRESNGLLGSLPIDDMCTGASITISNGEVRVGPSCRYTLRDLVNQYYVAYSAQLTRKSDIKFSPT